MPVSFAHKVHDAGYSEKWREGTVVLHSPNARIPLHPEMIPGASHEFLREDGRIMSLIPDFHPYISETIILIQEKSDAPRSKIGRKARWGKISGPEAESGK